MANKLIFTLMLLALIVSCQPGTMNKNKQEIFDSEDAMPGPEKPDLIFHYSVWFALENMLFASEEISGI